MDDRIRISDADRDRVTGRLRDHFAEGRLTPEELDERVTAALNAKTFGELRRVMADLPEPVPTQGQPQRPRPEAPPWIFRHRGPRVMPLVLLALLAALLIPGGGWLFFVFVKVFLVFWLVVFLAGIFLAGRFRRRMRRDWWARYARYGDAGWGDKPYRGHSHHGHAHHERACWRW